MSCIVSTEGSQTSPSFGCLSDPVVHFHNSRCHVSYLQKALKHLLPLAAFLILLFTFIIPDVMYRIYIAKALKVFDSLWTIMLHVVWGHWYNWIGHLLVVYNLGLTLSRCPFRCALYCTQHLADRKADIIC